MNNKKEKQIKIKIVIESEKDKTEFYLDEFVLNIKRDIESYKIPLESVSDRISKNAEKLYEFLNDVIENHPYLLAGKFLILLGHIKDSKIKTKKDEGIVIEPKGRASGRRIYL